MSKPREHEIALVITGDGKGGVKAVRATQQELDKLGKEQDKGAQKTRKYGESHKAAEKDVGRFRKTVERGAAIVVTAAAAATAAMTALFKVRAEAVEATVNMANMLDVSTQSFMGQAYAVSFLGIETQTYGDVMRETTKRVQEFATKGTGTAADFFRTMNLDVQEFANLKPDELMRRLGTELKDLNQNQRIMFLDMLGGQQAVMIGNVITELDRMEAEALAIGKALTDIDAQKLADSVTGMTKLAAVGEGAANQLSVGLAPIVTDITNRLYEAAVAGGGVGNAMDEMMDAAVVALGYPLNALQRWRELLALVKVEILELTGVLTTLAAEFSELTTNMINTSVAPRAGTIGMITQVLATRLGFAGNLPGKLGQPFRNMHEELSRTAAELVNFKVTVEEVEAASDSMNSRIAAARAEYEALYNEPPASDQLAQWLGDVRERAEEMAQAQVEVRTSVEGTGQSFDAASDKAQQLIRDMEFENSLMRMGNLQRQIQTNLRKLDANATDEQRAAVRRLTVERYNAEEAARREAEQAKLTGEIQKNQIQNVQKAYGDLIYGFLDEGKLRFKDFFDFITDGWKRTYSEFASRNFTSALFGTGNDSLRSILSGGQGGSGGMSGLLSGLSALTGLDKLPGLINNVTDFAGELFGYQGTVLPGPTADGSPLTAGLSERLPQGWDILKSAGYSMLGGFAGDKVGQALFGKEAESRIAATIGSAIGAFFGPLGAGIGSALGSLADVAFGGDGKKRMAAGFNVAPTPGGDPAYNFDVERFASGLSVTGVARRADQDLAKQVIEPFRVMDALVHGFVTELEGTLDLTRATLNGLNEEAQMGSSGTFLGKGGNGELAGDIPAQLRYFVGQLLDNVQGVSDEILAAARAADTAEQAIEILARAVDDKRQADEAAAVAAEESAAAAEALIRAEEDLLRARISTVNDLTREISAIRSARRALSMDMYSVLGATPLVNIEPTASELISAIQQQKSDLLQSYNDIFAAEEQLQQQRLQAAQSLRDAALQLRLGDTSTLTGSAQLSLVRAEFRSTLEAALGGDADAAQRLQQLAQSYAQESQAMFASNDEHQANMAEILGGLDQAAANLAAGSDFDPAAAQADLLAALRGLDQQLLDIATGVNDGIIDELQSIRLTLEDLSPQMRDSLFGAVSQWIDQSGPGGDEIIAALGGIRGSVDALPPEIAGYLSGAMGSWIQQMQSSGAASQVIADSISKGGLDESAANQWLAGQGAGSVDDYRSAYNPAFGAQEIAAHVNAVLGSSTDEAAAIAQLHAEATASGVGSRQLAEALGMSQQDVIDAVTRIGLPSFSGGGIAAGPSSGHLAMLHGTEAVVPLESGAIPVRVDMSAANDAIVRELRAVREDYRANSAELAALRKDMRAGMAFAAQQRDELTQATEQWARSKGARNGTIG